MSEPIYQVGNTVRLHCIFKDYDGLARDPDLLKVKIYDQSYKLIGDTTLGTSNKITVGEYFFDYTIPMDARGKLYYEWYGEMAGSPSLKRDSFKVAFI